MASGEIDYPKFLKIVKQLIENKDSIAFREPVNYKEVESNYPGWINRLPYHHKTPYGPRNCQKEAREKRL
jgi:hypothetical protein